MDLGAGLPASGEVAAGSFMSCLVAGSITLGPAQPRRATRRPPPHAHGEWSTQDDVHRQAEAVDPNGQLGARAAGIRNEERVRPFWVCLQSARATATAVPSARKGQGTV